MGRLHDKSSNVVKNAIQLTTIMLEDNLYGAMVSKLFRNIEILTNRVDKFAHTSSSMLKRSNKIYELSN